MAEQAADEKPGKKDTELQRELVVILRVDQQPGHRDERDQQQRPEEAWLVPAGAFEGDDEGGEIQRKRHEPQERHGCDVLREMVGDRE